MRLCFQVESAIARGLEGLHGSLGAVVAPGKSTSPNSPESLSHGGPTPGILDTMR